MSFLRYFAPLLTAAPKRLHPTIVGAAEAATKMMRLKRGDIVHSSAADFDGKGTLPGCWRPEGSPNDWAQHLYMKTHRFACMLGVAAILGSSATIGTLAAQTASMDLLRRGVNPNPTLNSYTASAALSATLHVLIPLHKNVNGTVYYLKPNRKIEFDNLSGSLARFKDLAASTPTYDEAIAKYTITPLTDDGKASSYLFVPKDTGSRVKSLTITVSDHRALIRKAVWAYTNGGTLSFTQVYHKLDDWQLPWKADIAARFPGYSVDGTLIFSNYQPNAPVSPSVFATPK